jgi:hypothetical protein
LQSLRDIKHCLGSEFHQFPTACFEKQLSLAGAQLDHELVPIKLIGATGSIHHARERQRNFVFLAALWKVMSSAELVCIGNRLTTWT